MVMLSLFWVALPMTVYAVLAACLPSPGPPPPWRVALRRTLDRLDERWHTWLRRNEPEPPDDPFEVLAVQVRLGVLAEQLRALESDPRVWARARRIEAVQLAYDGLLVEGCRLAAEAWTPSEPSGGEAARREASGSQRPAAEPPRRLTEPERLDDELLLLQHGWSW